MDKEMVVISKQWDNPLIHVRVTNKEISLGISLEDFIEAIKQEVGSVRWIVKDSTFNLKLDTAVKSILEKIKVESVVIV